MSETEHGWPMEELVRRSGVPARTIRYYITVRLLPGPQARGKAATYAEEHLQRLRLIRRLSEQHLPLTEIGHRLAGLSLTEIRALLDEEKQHEATLQQAEATRSPKDYIAGLLNRARAARSSMPASLAPPAAQEAEQRPPAIGHTLLEPTSSDEPVPAAEDWHRWELAPGIELQARSGAAATHRELIERLLQVANTHQPRQAGNQRASSTRQKGSSIR